MGHVNYTRIETESLKLQKHPDGRRKQLPIRGQMLRVKKTIRLNNDI